MIIKEYKYRKYKPGFKINKLLSIKYLYHTDSGKIVWLFKCDCGKEVISQLDNVVRGHTKSCNCFINGNVRKSMNGAFRRCLKDYKLRAIKKGMEFNLTDLQFEQLTSKKCKYCNDEPYQICFNKSKKDRYIYNGIDRVDNTKGYTIDNCVPCCGICNRMKRALSLEDFIKHIKKINKNFINE